jgi:hypothetical protein
MKGMHRGKCKEAMKKSKEYRRHMSSKMMKDKVKEYKGRSEAYRKNYGK